MMGILNSSAPATSLAKILSESLPAPFSRLAWGPKHVRPNCGLEFIFLADAVEEMGKARFGDDWTGNEMTTLLDNRFWQLADIPTIDDTGDYDAIKSARSRAYAAMSSITDAGRNALIETFLFVDGPVATSVPLEFVPNNFWFGSNRYKYFYECKGLFHANGIRCEGWIFIRASSLKSAIASRADTPVSFSRDELERLPPLLALCIKIALANENLANLENRAVRQLAVDALVEAYGSESGTYQEAMRTVLSPVNMAKVIAAKKGRQPKKSAPTKE